MKTGKSLHENLERIYFATLISLHADALARAGGGYINFDMERKFTAIAEKTSPAVTFQAASM